MLAHEPIPAAVELAVDHPIGSMERPGVAAGCELAEDAMLA